MPTIIAILLGLVAVSAAIVVVIYMVVPILRLIANIVGRVFRFIGAEISDTLRVLGGVLTTIVFIPLTLVSIVIGRWSAASHYGRSIQGEIGGVGYALYRIFVGNPARMLGLTALTDGIERRVPEAMAKAPGRDKPSKRVGQFDGYNIVGSIAGGGSGARLYVAEPDAMKRAVFARQGLDVGQVVIKSFSLKEGSSLPQILREGRALEAAKKIGLVLDHELSEHRFYYVMPFVPGDDLGATTHRLHEASGPGGLTPKRLEEALGYAADLLATLDHYHRSGLWHKDVKPDNIIVHDGRAHLVDLGLVTPLRSAMTLTTHGTEYFRDPEMVRMALKGVKVHEVNGEKFDVYAAGAVLYSMVENSFPAHGGLSQLTKSCPEALRWIIRRAMTDYNNRYVSAGQMLADLRTVLHAQDMHAVKPADLPSMKQGDAPAEFAEAKVEELPPLTPAAHVAGAAVAAGADGQHAPPAGDPPRVGVPRNKRQRPDLVVTSWWKGTYTPRAGGAPGDAPPAAARVRRSPAVPREHRAPAAEQLRRARERARTAQARAASRAGHKPDRYSNNPNAGVAVAFFSFLGACVLIAGGVIGVGVLKDAVGQKNQSSIVVNPRVEGERPGMTIDLTDTDLRSLRETLIRDFNIDPAALDPERTHEFAELIEAQINEVVTRITERVPALGRGAPGRARATAPAPPAPPAPVTDAWLVIDDLGDSASPALRDAAARAVEAMQRAGFPLVGVAGDEAEIEHVASARARLGVVQPGDPQSTELMLGWLRDRAGQFSGVLWLPKPTQRNELAPRLFSADSELARRASRALELTAR